ncbi:uncharacterized protein [Nicotiana tomentosiformis]|uniref:uncharacterized protein n=1 Tax=Nicotiana tomentosiformis TaxID=4098 RepID=UPI00388C88F9
MWSRAMKLALGGKSKLGFVYGSCVKSMYKGELAGQWEKCNAIVLSWIGSTVASELIPSIMFASSAKKFLMGLNESYSNVRSNVLMKRPVVSVNEAYAIVTQEESQRALGVTDMNKDPLTMMAGRPQYNRPKKIRMICEHCGYKGHLKKNCYKIVGYPADFKSKKKTHIAGGSMTFANNASAKETSNSEGQPHGHYLTQE